MALTLVEQSLMFRHRKPRTVFALPAIIAYVLAVAGCQGFYLLLTMHTYNRCVDRCVMTGVL